MIKAVIFDLDGVLVDATEWHYLALNKALNLFGYAISRQEHEDFYNGLPTRKKLEHLSQEKGLPLGLHGFINQMKQKYTQGMIETHCNPDFEKMYLLKKLKEQGYHLAVCSNAVRITVETMLKRSGLYQYLDLILSNEDIKKPKPAPEIYLKTFDRLKVKPSECLIVEDAEHGKKAAYASGAQVLEVDGYNDVNFELVNNFLKDIKGGK